MAADPSARRHRGRRRGASGTGPVRQIRSAAEAGGATAAGTPGPYRT